MIETGTPFRDAMLAQTVATLLRSHNAITWRAVEGVGFMRGDVFNSGGEGDGELVSIHVWHPDLYEPAMEDSGGIHDHRFAFRSVVLLGAIHDTEIVSLVPVEEDEGAYRIHEVALSGQSVRSRVLGTHFQAPRYIVTEQPQRYRLVTSPHTYRAGTTFAYAPGRFHRATVTELAVTVCWKAGHFGGGRLLARAGHVPKRLDAGIGLDRFTRKRTAELLMRAAAALESAAALPYPTRPWLPG